MSYLILIGFSRAFTEKKSVRTDNELESAGAGVPFQLHSSPSHHVRGSRTRLSVALREHIAGARPIADACRMLI